MSLVIGKSVSDLNYIGQHNIFMLMWGSTVSFGEHPPFKIFGFNHETWQMLTRTPLGLYLVEFEHHETKYGTIKFPHYVE